MNNILRFCARCGKLASCVIEHPTRIGKYGEQVIEAEAVCPECVAEEREG